MMHAVQFSGGISSWAAARIVKDSLMAPGDSLHLVFADTLIEDPDLYRFLADAQEDLQPDALWRLVDGRTPWQVFDDVKMLGGPAKTRNGSGDPCSYHLKRKQCRRWVETFCDPDHTTIYIGIHWEEITRAKNYERYWKPYRVRMPLCEPPYPDRKRQLELANERGLVIPWLTQLGFPHNNCSGFCIKAGQAQFRQALMTLPSRYREWEDRELAWQEKHGKKNTWLRDRRGGVTKPMSLREYRERLERQQTMTFDDQHDWGGCRCFEPSEDELCAL